MKKVKILPYRQFDRHIMHRCVYMILALVMLMTVSVMASVPEVIVDDAAGLFSVSESEKVTKAADKLSRLTNSVIMAVTTDDANGRTARKYAEDYCVAHTDETDAAVFLIDMDNRELYIATTGIMYRKITDDEKDWILDAGYDQASEGEFGRAMMDMIDAAYRYCDENSDAAYTDNTSTGEHIDYTGKENGSFFSWQFLLLAMGAGAVLAILIFAGVTASYRMKFSRYHYDYRSNSRVSLRRRDDVLVNRFVTKRKIPKNPPPSSGGHGHGFGGGSTIHTGSGGRTFGGGGRKF